MRVEPFAGGHFASLTLQPHQAVFQSTLTEQDWDHLGKAGEAWTGFVGERVVACAGILDIGGGRGQAWSLLGDLGPVMVPLTRAVQRGLDICGYRYVQALTSADFAPAHRWAAMLGFASRGLLPGYCDDGRDALIWTRTR